MYKFIREYGGWDNFSVEKLEENAFENKQEKHKREKELIDKHKSTLNKYQPGRTLYESNKAYHIKNKEKIKIWNNTKHKCTCGGKYCNSSKSKHLKSKKHFKWLVNHVKTELNRISNDYEFLMKINFI